jgi:fructose-1,6-bisphosphatase I
MAFIVEQAGGKSITSSGQMLLEIVPSAIHERSGIILGSPEDVQDYMSCLSS